MTETTPAKRQSSVSQQPAQLPSKEKNNLSLSGDNGNEIANKLASEEALTKLSQLEEQLKMCVKTQQFVEAETFKNKIKEIKLDILLKKSKEMEIRHLQELNSLEEAQALESDNFNKEWDLSISKFKQEARTAEEEMMKKHENDLISLEQDLQMSLPLLIRTSPKIMNIKKMIETLAKQNDFVQANNLKAQCNVLEQQELRRSEEQKDKKILYILNQLANKQTNELNGLRKRVATSYSELLKARATEYQKLIFKLSNIRKSIENTQQIELSKFEIAYKNYIPGETIKFKIKRRDNLAPIPPRNINKVPSSLNSSFTHPVKTANPTAPTNVAAGNKAKRSVTPSRNNYHIRGLPQSSLLNRSNLVPSKPNARAASSNPRANKSVLEGVTN